jgi:cellulose synthase/poly-beta-1,6-N-acetylglucosamine synthase-like glycosyltransferase
MAFTARRLLLLLAALAPPAKAARRPTATPPKSTPHVLILLPCRNEAESLPALLAGLEELDYPRDCLTVVVLDDASTDHTARVAREWRQGRPWLHLLSLKHNAGKPAALNAGLDQFPAGELVAVYDADCRPAPDSLRRLVRALDCPDVGAANGFLLALNSVASLPAYYAAVEHLVHQCVTTMGKDRLQLAPPILGSNCVYRRSALRAAGYFRPGLLLEDSNLTLGLALVGYRTCFVPEAVAFTSVPESLGGYWKQHVRWARGFQQVAGLQSGAVWRDRRLPLALRLELIAFALGYADRLGLLAAAGLTAAEFAWPGLTGFPRWAWPVYFGAMAAQIVAALALAPRKVPARMYAYLPVIPFFFAFDLAMSLWSAGLSLLGRPARWTVTERPLAQSR